MKPFWVVLFSLTTALHSVAPTVDVVLMEFVYKNDFLDHFTESSASFDIAELELRKKYASVVNFTRVRVQDNSYACHPPEPRSAFLASRFYYQEVSRNASVGMFFSAAAALCLMASGPVGDLARVWFDFFYNFLKEYGYTRVGCLSGDEPQYKSTCNDLLHTLQRRSDDAARELLTATVQVNSGNKTSLGLALENMKSITRVVVIAATNKAIRRIMLTAFDKGMTDGSYVFVTFDRSNRNRPAFLNADQADERFEDALTAFRSLFTISFNIQNTSEYRDFTNEVRRLSAEHYGITYNANEEINIRAVFNYHALAIYGQVLNESIANGWDTRDGARLVQLMRNRTFTILGNEILINTNGDRESNWVLNQMDPMTGLYRAVLTDSNSGKAVEPFRDPLDKSVHPILWYNRTGPPPNGPNCDCRSNKL